jgi:hypothetical protein
MESGQDYAQGVALYETHGKSRVVLRSLQYGATEFTRATLRRELAKLVGSDVTVNVSADVSVKPVRVVDTSEKSVHETAKTVHVGPKKVDSSPGKMDSLSTQLVKSDEPAAELRRQRSTWYAERARLHAQLELVATEDERRVMGERILVLSELISVSYDAPAESDITQTTESMLSDLSDQGEIRRLLANRRCLASKLKKNPARAADLATTLADIKLLETKLKPKS